MEQKKKKKRNGWLQTVFCCNFDVYEKLINFEKQKKFIAEFSMSTMFVKKTGRIFRAATADEAIKKAKQNGQGAFILFTRATI